MKDEKYLILIVEDDAVNAMAAALTIENFGYKAVTVNTGEKAVTMVLNTDSIDLILMDIDLGFGIDGPEAARQILEKKNIPIVFLTSHSEKEYVDKVKEITRYGYVIKNSGDFVLRSSIEMAFELYDAHIKIESKMESLRLRESYLSAIIENQPGLVWLKDTEGKFLAVNMAFALTCGKNTPEEVLGLTDLDIWPRELAEKYKTDDAEVMLNKKTLHTEESILDRMRTKWFETFKTPILNKAGNVIGTTGFARDITERKEAEAVIREKNELFSLFMRHSPIYCYIKEVTPTRSFVLQASENYQDMIGIPGSKMIGKTMEELFPEEFAAKITADDWAVVSSGVVLKLDEELNGRSYTSIKYPIIQGDKTLLAGYTIDITERKQAEEKIKSLLAEKEVILKEVHHRIKNNMNTIKSLLNLQAATLQEPLAVGALIDASSRVQSMTVLYDKLYQTELFKNVAFQVYLPTLIQQIIDNYPNSSSVKLETLIDDFVLDPKILSVLGIIINELVTNIMKYAFAGKSGGIITVTASLKEKLITLIIEDNGNGIPETVNFENSSGFGLKLVSLLTKQLEGTIRIERVQGTRIVIEFYI